MTTKNLQFFDNNGYNLNFSFNEKYGYWEGTIYFPKVSVGLYANTTIYVLEQVDNATLMNPITEIDSSYDPNQFDTNYVFPYGDGKITFTWDSVNKFVDEFFMFTFDDTFKLQDTSALVYKPNDGPDCETLIINRFDKYEIELDNTYISKALPIHIAFMANEKYDATTYNRTLIMSYNNQTIARITFYAETVEEDERLKIWNNNLGYNITPEDEMIFYKSNIKEYKPDYKLLNEKRKELMMEGSNIYPYIGSYKAIINAIKFFGYDNLNIIEYWRNVNPKDENFGKIYHSSKYSLTKKETLRIGARNIVLPNNDYKKMNALALVYSINQPTGEVDEWELPYMKEKFTYTIEEALIKLFALRKKLNREFMPGSSKIIDILGEANYFTIHGLTKVHDEYYSEETSRELNLSFDVEPSQYGHITDNTYFGRYINIKANNDNTEQVSIVNQILSDMYNTQINDVVDSHPSSTNNLNDATYNISSLLLRLFPDKNLDDTGELNNYKCNFYKDYYREAFVDHTIYKAIQDNDDYPFDHDETNGYPTDEYNYTDSLTRFSAKFVLKNTTFDDITFENCELKFNCVKTSISNNNINTESTGNDIKFNTIDTYVRPNKISWTIQMSKDQHDEDFKNANIEKEYTYHSDFVYSVTCKDISKYNQIFVELPYIGYYDVTMEIGYGSEMLHKQTRTKKKFLKVEPYQIDLIGFYYDARDLPENLQYEGTDEMQRFIQTNIFNMHRWATSERSVPGISIDASMPYYTGTGEIVGTGPYFNKNIDEEWYLANNFTFEIGDLRPFAKYTRYIRSGVDVKPFTWFLLGFEYSKIAGKVKPRWSITNNETKLTRGIYGEFGQGEFDNKQYLTLLLKKEGKYTINLELEDRLGNVYKISRNIIVVSKSANYKLYQTFKREYDFMTEQEMLKQLNEFYFDDKEDVEN